MPAIPDSLVFIVKVKSYGMLEKVRTHDTTFFGTFTRLLGESQMQFVAKVELDSTSTHVARNVTRKVVQCVWALK